MEYPKLVVGKGIVCGEGVIIEANYSNVWGEVTYDTPGTYTWIAPADVYLVCVVCVGGGGSGTMGTSPSSITQYRYGGGGGGLGWKNFIRVIPGQGYTVEVGAGGVYNNGGDSYFISKYLVAGFGGKDYTGVGGGFVGDDGGIGGNGGAATIHQSYQYRIGGGAGGGAGGYVSGGTNGYGGYYPVVPNSTYPVVYPGSGFGGGAGGGWADLPNNYQGGPNYSYGAGPGGSGVGILGIGATGNYYNGVNWEGGPLINAMVSNTTGSPGSGGEWAFPGLWSYPPNEYHMKGGNGGKYGGGGGSCGPWQTNPATDNPGWGAGGAVRIIWGPDRYFPDQAGPLTPE